jgi:ABC-type transporter Mla maintaining outer membrane lipid asymmetry ATPase subunit MlaF
MEAWMALGSKAHRRPREIRGGMICPATTGSAPCLGTQPEVHLPDEFIPGFNPCQPGLGN